MTSSFHIRTNILVLYHQDIGSRRIDFTLQAGARLLVGRISTICTFQLGN